MQGEAGTVERTMAAASGEPASRSATVVAWLGAVGASSCCIVPLLLVAAGLGGAWVGTLTSLAPYQPLFVIPGAVAVTYGLWRHYRQPACEACRSRILSRRLRGLALWGAALLLLISATTPLWMPLVLG